MHGIDAHGSDSEVELAGWYCDCLKCKKVDEVPANQESVSSLLAGQAGYVDPRKGPGMGQKVETMAMRKPAAAATSTKAARSSAAAKKAARKPAIKNDGGKPNPIKRGQPKKTEHASLRTRTTDGQEQQYILGADGKCWCGCSKKRSDKYQDIMTAVLTEVLEGSIPDKRSAKLKMELLAARP